jgi:hypothetical protein
MWEVDNRLPMFLPSFYWAKTIEKVEMSIRILVGEAAG